MNTDKKLHIAFNWVVYMASSFQPPQDWYKTIDLSTKPLVEMLHSHPRVKSNFSVGGWVAEWLYENKPEFVKLLKKGVDDGRFEIVNRPYFHATMSMLAYDEAAEQIRRSVAINERIWGVRPTGAHHNGWPWDPVTGKALADNGIQYQMLANWQLYNHTEPPLLDKAATYRAARIKTVDEGEISSLFVSFSKGDIGVPQEMSPVYFLQVLQGHKPLESFKKGIEALQEANRDGDMFVLLFSDSETFWREPQTGSSGLSPEEMFARLEAMLHYLESLPFVEFTTGAEYLRKFPPKKSYYIRPSVSPFGPGQGFDSWADGAFKQAYNLNIQCARATEDIHTAEAIIKLASKFGAETGKAETLVKEAWEYLMLSKTAVGRALAPREAVSIWCAENAIAASRAARRAIDAIVVK